MRGALEEVVTAIVNHTRRFCWIPPDILLHAETVPDCLILTSGGSVSLSCGLNYRRILASTLARKELQHKLPNVSDCTVR